MITVTFKSKEAGILAIVLLLLPAPWLLAIWMCYNHGFRHLQLGVLGLRPQDLQWYWTDLGDGSLGRTLEGLGPA